MKRIRSAAAAIVLVSTLGLSTTACTPAEAKAFGDGVGLLIGLIWWTNGAPGYIL